jgi:hypothetical protein
MIKTFSPSTNLFQYGIVVFISSFLHSIFLLQNLAQTQAGKSFLSTTPCRYNEMQAYSPILQLGVCATFAQYRTNIDKKSIYRHQAECHTIKGSGCSNAASRIGKKPK